MYDTIDSMTLRNTTNSQTDGLRHGSTESGRSIETVRGPFGSFGNARGTAMKVRTADKRFQYVFHFSSSGPRGSWNGSLPSHEQKTIMPSGIVMLQDSSWQNLLPQVRVQPHTGSTSDGDMEA